MGFDRALMGTDRMLTQMMREFRVRARVRGKSWCALSETFRPPKKSSAWPRGSSVPTANLEVGL